MHLPKLSTLASVVTSVPKPPLSLLRLGAVATPMGGAIVAGTLVAGVAITHHEEIGNTLGNLAHGAKDLGKSAVSTTEKVAGVKTDKPDDGNSMIVPLLVVGGLVGLFFLMKK